MKRRRMKTKTTTTAPTMPFSNALPTLCALAEIVQNGKYSGE